MSEAKVGKEPCHGTPAAGHPLHEGRLHTPDFGLTVPVVLLPIYSPVLSTCRKGDSHGRICRWIRAAYPEKTLASLPPHGAKGGKNMARARRPGLQGVRGR